MKQFQANALGGKLVEEGRSLKTFNSVLRFK